MDQKLADPFGDHRPPDTALTEYEDLIVQLLEARDGVHGVLVVDSPKGARFKQGHCRVPELELVSASRTMLHTRGGVYSAPVAPPPPLAPEAIGQALFDAVFNGDILTCFLESHAAATARGHRLRVRLRLNVDDAGISSLATLPWEFMYWPQQRRFMVLSPDTTLVREVLVSTKHRYESGTVNGRLRVLFVIANPNGDLDLEAERGALDRLLAAAAADERAGHESPARRPFSAEFIDNATFTSFADRLHSEDYHVVHFMGHGVFDSTLNGGQLLFQDGPKPASELTRLFANEKKTRLVVLNACRTAEAAGAAGDPFAGVATAILLAGVPAVVAMQFPISDGAAIAFSERLYSELGRGTPLEAAVDSGREHLKNLAPARHEWATPVLFLNDTSALTTEVSVRSARTGIETLETLTRRVPAVADAVGRCRETIENVYRQIGRLESFKSLHDALHAIEFECLRPMQASGRGGRLTPFKNAFTNQVEGMQTVLNGEDIPRPLREAMADQVADISSAFAQAIDVSGPEPFEALLAALNDLLSGFPSRLNAGIADAAAQIDIDRLVTALTTIRIRVEEAGSNPGELAALVSGIQALQAIRDQLEMRTTEHSLLQELDLKLRAVCVGGTSRSIESEWVRIARARHKIVPPFTAELWRLIDTMVADEYEMNAALAAREFEKAHDILDGYFYSVSSTFREIDSSLKRFCFSLTEVSQPLKGILELR